MKKIDKIERKVLDFAKDWYDVKTDDEARAAVVEEWGKDGLRGYGKFRGGVCTKDGKEPLYIARLDEFGIYDGDMEAAKQAEKDGIKLIPYKEQPKYEDCRHVRFVDTKANRKLLGL